MIPPEYLAYYTAIPIGFTEHSDPVPLAPTRSKKKHVEAIATMVNNGPTVGPPKTKVGLLKMNMMIVDAKSSSQKSIMAISNKRS